MVHWISACRLIAGAGAIGSIVGGMLHRAGHDVTLLGRRAHLEAIARDGLRITGIFGERKVHGIWRQSTIRRNWMRSPIRKVPVEIKQREYVLKA